MSNWLHRIGKSFPTALPPGGCRVGSAGVRRSPIDRAGVAVAVVTVPSNRQPR